MWEGGQSCFFIGPFTCLYEIAWPNEYSVFRSASLLCMLDSFFRMKITGRSPNYVEKYSYIKEYNIPSG